MRVRYLTIASTCEIRTKVFKFPEDTALLDSRDLKTRYAESNIMRLYPFNVHVTRPNSVLHSTFRRQILRVEFAPDASDRFQTTARPVENIRKNRYDHWNQYAYTITTQPFATFIWISRTGLRYKTRRTYFHRIPIVVSEKYCAFPPTLSLLKSRKIETISFF